jgi:hypothetical protein
MDRASKKCLPQVRLQDRTHYGIAIEGAVPLPTLGGWQGAQQAVVRQQSLLAEQRKRQEKANDALPWSSSASLF